MEFRLSPILAFLSLALVASHAALSPELYWISVLPNTPMPKAVQDLLQPDVSEEKSTSVNVGKGGVNVDAGKGKPGGTSVDVGKGDGVTVDAGKGKPGGGTHVNVGGKGVGVDAGTPGKRTNVGVGKGGVTVNTGPKGKPVYVGVKPGPSPFDYNYAATENQLQDDKNTALFFLEKDLHPGMKMNLHFTQNSNRATFLPREVAKSIPFSSDKLPEIFNEFSVKPGSVEAEIMQNTIKGCEEPGIEGEQKYCATSLESMIDFSTTKLGKNVRAVSTEVTDRTRLRAVSTDRTRLRAVSTDRTRLQVYTIAAAVKQMAADKSVVCHKENYAYAVFYCHATDTTKVYMVSLEGEDGTKAKAVSVCHTDTSAWNPKHLAFQVLKVKPGTVPVCHFLPQDHIVWVPNK